MSSKLKKLKELERKLTISIPVEDYQSKFQSKLNNIKGKAKLDGCRKGKEILDLVGGGTSSGVLLAKKPFNMTLLKGLPTIVWN